jgi:hypothetical protein
LREKKMARSAILPLDRRFTKPSIDTLHRGEAGNEPVILIAFYRRKPRRAFHSISTPLNWLHVENQRFCGGGNAFWWQKQDESLSGSLPGRERNRTEQSRMVLPNHINAKLRK